MVKFIQGDVVTLTTNKALQGEDIWAASREFIFDCYDEEGDCQVLRLPEEEHSYFEEHQLDLVEASILPQAIKLVEVFWNQARSFQIHFDSEGGIQFNQDMTLSSKGRVQLASGEWVLIDEAVNLEWSRTGYHITSELALPENVVEQVTFLLLRRKNIDFRLVDWIGPQYEDPLWKIGELIERQELQEKVFKHPVTLSFCKATRCEFEEIVGESSYFEKCIFNRDEPEFFLSKVVDSTLLGRDFNGTFFE